MKLSGFASALLILTLGCASHPTQNSVASGGLFPFADYRHTVKIKVLNPPKTYTLHGVVAYTPEHLKVVGLSDFSTTVFRIDETLPHGPIEKKFYVDAIRQHEAQFMQIYQLIRSVMTAPKGTTAMDLESAHFQFSEPDAQGVPRKITVTHPQFTLEIQVDDYDF